MTKITIKENDTPPASGVIQFSGSRYSVDENSVSATVTLVRSGGSFGTLQVQLNSSDNTALAGTDYQSVDQLVSFAEGETSKVIQIMIVDDAHYEGDKTFYLTLSNSSNSESIGTLAEAEVVIVENDPTPPSGVISFHNSSLAVAESVEEVKLTLVRTGGAYGTVSVELDVAASTNLDSDEYHITPRNFIFEQGETTKTFVVSITNDAEVEQLEQLVLTLKGNSSALGNPSSFILSVSDDDAGRRENMNLGGSSIDWSIGLMLLLYCRRRRFR